MALRVRGQGSTDSDLSPELIDLLLGGWGCPILPEHFEGDAFAIFTLDDDELRERWRKHRTVLLAEAARRGLDRPWGARTV